MPAELLVDPASYDVSRPIMGREEIEALIPHRGSMLLVDGILRLDTDARIVVGTKTYREDEFWAAGHFPGDPIVPGVVLVESSAQVALVYYKTACPELRNRLIVFGGIEVARFRDVVRPGQQVVLQGKLTSGGRRISRYATQAIVGDRIVYNGEMIALPK